MNRPLQILSLTVASLLFAACGDSTEKTPDSGGSPSNSNSSGQPESGGQGESGQQESNPAAVTSSPVGEWRLDVEKTMAENPGMVPAGIPESAMVQMKQMLASMTMTLSEDGTARTVSQTPIGNNDDTGTWSLEGDQITLVTENDDEDKPDSITFEDDKIVMRVEQDGQQRVMVFVRK